MKIWKYLFLAALVALAACQATTDETVEVQYVICEPGEVTPDCPTAHEWVDSVIPIKLEGGG